MIVVTRNENHNISLIAKYYENNLYLIKYLNNQFIKIQNFSIEKPLNLYLSLSTISNEINAIIFLIYQQSLSIYSVNLSTNSYFHSNILLSKSILSLEYFNLIDSLILISSSSSSPSSSMTTSNCINELQFCNHIYESKSINIENLNFTYGNLNKYLTQEQLIFNSIIKVSTIDSIFVLLSLSKNIYFYLIFF